MAPFLAAMRRLFPPLKVKRKLLTTISVLAIYGLLVRRAVTIAGLPPIEWGAEEVLVFPSLGP